MPELPEVETTKKSLNPLFGLKVQQVHVRFNRLRWPVAAHLEQLHGQNLVSVKRRAKYLIFQFQNVSLLAHLGMSGSFTVVNQPEALRKHDHVVIDFESDNGKILQLRYHDPRRFGCILWLHNELSQKLLANLGPEPLSNDFNVAYLSHKLKNKKSAIKVAIMDNAVVVGVGNIYATEVLFNCGIHPATPAYQISEIQIQHLVLHIKAILQQAIQVGGSTLRDFVYGQQQNGYFQQTLLVYGRKGQSCVTCQTTLQEIKLGQRASVFCPQCQMLKCKN